MENLRIYLPLVNGSGMSVGDDSTGREIIETFLGDDWGPPPEFLVLEAKADNGRTVRLVIPYSNSTRCHVDFGDDD